MRRRIRSAWIWLVVLALFGGAVVSLGAPRLVSAAAITSAQTGNWNDTSTWLGGVVPGAGDDVTIDTGQTVTVPVGFAAAATTLTIDGVIFNNGDLTVSGAISGPGGLTQEANSTLSVGGALTVATFNANGNPNAVNFTGSIAQQIPGVVYHHLSTSGDQIKQVAGSTQVNGNLAVTGTSTFEVPGVNFTVTGTTTVSGALTITSAVGSKTFEDDVTMQAGSTWNNSADETVTLGGSLSIHLSSTFTSGSGAYIMGGAFKTVDVPGSGGNSPTIDHLTVTGIVTNNGSIVVNNLDGFGTFTNAGNLVLGGANTVTTFDASTVGNNVTWGGGAQAVRAIAYHNLQLLGGTKTLTGVTTINGYLRLAQGADAATPGDLAIGAEICLANGAQFTVNAGHTVTVGTNVEVGSGTCGTPQTGTLTNNGTVTASGALSGSGTFENGVNGTLNLGGSATVSTLTANANGNLVNYTGAGQTVKGTAYRNLSITGTTATLGGDASVSGNLNLTGGTLATGVNTLAAGDATVSRTTGHVIGNLQKTFPTGASTGTFEVGTTGVYAPATVVFDNVSVSGSLTVSSTAGEHPNIGSSTLDGANSVNRYWTITNAGITFTTADITFTFVAGDLDGGTSTGSLIAAKRDGTTWTTPTVGTRTATSTQVTGVTSFSEFALAEPKTISPPAPPSAEPDPPAQSSPPAAELPSVTLGTASTGQVSSTTATTVNSTSSSGTTAQVTVPPGALPAGATVQVAPITDPTALAAAAPPPAGATVLAGFQINAMSTTGAAITGDFAAPVDLVLTFPASILSGGALTLAFWNGSSWVTVPATVTTNSDGSVTVQASVTHFTVFSLLRIVRPAFTPEPAAHGFSLAVWSGGTLADLAGVLAPRQAVWVFVQGEAIGYLVGAPAFVNAPFVAAYPDGLAAGSLVVVVK